MTVRPTLHPLAESYLAELDRLLAGVDPTERHETLLGVREHIEAATAGDPGDEAVRRALAELGSPQAVADEAYAGLPKPAQGGGMAIGVALLQALALLIIVMVVGSGSGISESSTSSGSSAGGVVQETVVKTWTGSAGIALVAFVFACVAWVPAALLASLSALWTSREKRLHVALVPAAALLMGALPEIGYRLAGFTGVVLGAWAALLLTVFGGGWLIVRLTRAGRSRAA